MSKMAMPGDIMCGLHVVRNWHGQETILQFLVEAGTGHTDSISLRVCKLN